MDSANGDDAASVHLPHELILDILRRLPLRALAASRRVCRAWRAAVDDNALLLSHFHRLFPQRDFPGMFISFEQGEDIGSCFFAPPLPLPGCGDEDDETVFRRPLFRHDWANVMDHCNGLLLLHGSRGDRICCVCNPATLRCARLPPPPTWSPYEDRGMFLAFDPAVSRHHEVFFFPQTKTQLRPEKEVQRRVEIHRPWDEISLEQLRSCRLFEDDEDQFFEVEDLEEGQGGVQQQEQPRDEVLSLMVFSSQTGQWDSRDFVPGRCNPEHLSAVMDVSRYGWQEAIWKSAQYWRGSLYMHCHNNILMILRNSQRTYDTIQLPGIACTERECERMFVFELPTRSVVASYDHGVRYVSLNMLQLQVWTLAEPTDGQLGWMLTHEANLNPYGFKIGSLSLPIQSMTPWKTVKSSEAKVSLFEPRTYIEKYFHNKEYGRSKEKPSNNEEEPVYFWNPDNDNFIYLDESAALLESPNLEYMSRGIMGLHPHKDVLFLRINNNVMAYHISTSRMQYLGHQKGHNVNRTFPYRACYIDALPTWKMPGGP